MGKDTLIPGNDVKPYYVKFVVPKAVALDGQFQKDIDDAIVAAVERWKAA